MLLAEALAARKDAIAEIDAPIARERDGRVLERMSASEAATVVVVP